ncbi:MAG TPA: hypothetical protein ENI86_14565 [Acidimicrobiales bacterium]|nr:hypothetical protein [Acidimicrobiales bacterium]
MSTLWTPDGEHPVEPAGSPPPSQENAAGGAGPDELDEAQAREMAQKMAEAQEALAQAPVDQVVSNHVMGLFELAAIHLRKQPPDLVSARLPIDAMGLLIDNLGDRLFEAETLTAALNQLRMAYVELARAGAGDQDETEGDEEPSGSEEASPPEESEPDEPVPAGDTGPETASGEPTGGDPETS